MTLPEIKTVHSFLALQRSVRLSGEPWSETCEAAETDAFAALDTVSVRIAAGDEALGNALASNTERTPDA